MIRISTLAIIPSRSGSKRLKNKNLIEIDGVPLLGNAVSLAKSSRLFDRIIVSTNDSKAAEIAKNYGAEIPKLRSEELSDDYATIKEVILDALSYEWLGDFKPEFICCIFPVTPLLEVRHLEESFDVISRKKCDYVFHAIPYSHPVDRGFFLGTDNKIEMKSTENALTRTQDLRSFYHDSGQYYWGTWDAWKSDSQILGVNSVGIEAKPYEFIDVDNWEDLNFAKLILESRKA